MERNVRKYFNLILYIIIYSSKTSKRDLSDEFIEFFIKFSIIEKLSEEQDFFLKCCLALFQSYIEHLNKPDEKIKETWNLKIKPILLKKYPIQKSGIFNVNADVEFLIKEIDNINAPQKDISESDQSYIRSRLHDIRLKTIYISSKFNMRHSNKTNNNNYNYNKMASSNITNNPNKININENKINNQNKLIYNNTFKNVKINDLMKKELEQNMNLMKKGKTQNKIDEKNIVEEMDKEFDIMMPDKRRNNSVDEQKSRSIMLAKPFDPYKYVNEMDNNDNNGDNDDNNSESNKKKIMLIVPEKKQKKVKELSPNYVDVHENENTIKYKNKELKMINLDLLLKSIVNSDFLEKYINYIYFFAQQCFCFIQKEVIFQKIINCYNFFKKLNTPFIYLKKIIYFFNLLVIEMYKYFNSIPIKQTGPIRKFYNNLEDELKKKIGLSKNENNNKRLSNKIDEKVKLMGKMIDRLQSNPNIKVKEEKNTNINILNTSKTSKIEKIEKNEKNEKNEKKEKNEKYPDEYEILEEIKYIIALFGHEEPKSELIVNAQKNTNFFKLKYTLYDSKFKKKQQNIKRAITTQNTPVRKSQKINKKNKICFSILDWDPSDIGEALIYVSKNELIKIERKELYKAIFLKKTKNKTCPNIMSCISKFNNLTSFIMEDILSYDFPKERARIIEGWIKVAEYLKLRRDHNDCVAVYSALKHYIITGLKLTIKEIKTKYKNLFKDISEYCTFQGNYKHLREEINICINCKEFYLPYLGMLLRDISFFEANYEYLINGNLINIEKMEKVQNTIDKFFIFKTIPDLFNKNNEFPHELHFFDKLEKVKGEDELDIIANKLEPKFILDDIQRKKKRPTYIDKKYFRNISNNEKVKKKKKV